MKLGAEDKRKVMLLGGLMVVGGYFFYSNVISDGTPSPSPAPRPSVASQRNADVDSATALPVTAPAPTATSSTQPRPLVNRNSRGDEFHPVLRKKNARPEEQQIDLNQIDPTLHLELLAKVQNLKPEGGQRNLFQFGAAAPPPPAQLKGEEPKVFAMGKPVIFPQPVKPPAPPPPPPPPTPPSFKYYGLATKRIDNKRTAFFLDGEEIIFAIEGMTVKGRWRVLRIGADSVMLEDTQSKRQQPLTLSEDVGGPS
jgi:hypothetical protein